MLSHHRRLLRRLYHGVAPTYTITGYAYDADGSTGVVGATVALGAYSATSGVGGAYTISNIPAGTSGSMTCTLAGYSWTAITVAAMSANLTSQNYTNAWWAGGGNASSCVAAYLAKGAASQEAARVNLANPGTYNLTVPSGFTEPTWSSEIGWTTAANTKTYETGMLPAAPWSVFIKFSSNNVEENQIFGIWEASTSCRFTASGWYFSTNLREISLFIGSPLSESDSKFQSGVWGLGQSEYQNGVKIQDLNAHRNTIYPSTDTIWLFATHRGTGAHRQYSGTLQAISFYNQKISDAHNLIISTAMAAL